MKIVVRIINEESKNLENLYYTYNASLDIISYLMSQEKINIKKEYLIDYLNNSETKFMELEKEKEFLSQKYLPDELKNKKYNYTFDFINESIIYEY